MKLNSSQISVLAQEVLEQIKKNSRKEVTKEHKEIIKKYLQVKKNLQKDIDNLNKQKKSLHTTLEKNLGWYVSDWKSNSYDSIVKEQEDNTPSLTQIKNKITLYSVFETKETLQEYIKNLVKELSK